MADHNRIEMIKVCIARDVDNMDVLGFYYLLNTSLEPDDLGSIGQSEPLVFHAKTPAVYLGMIGVHEPLTRQGLGTQLMIHIFRRVIEIATLSGLWALTLDADDDEAVIYYQRFEFRRFGSGREMYIPLSTIKRLIERMDEAA
jgi:GNAT superfamily N-acetyltransferase